MKLNALNELHWIQLFLWIFSGSFSFFLFETQKDFFFFLFLPPKLETSSFTFDDLQGREEKNRLLRHKIFSRIFYWFSLKHLWLNYWRFDLNSSHSCKVKASREGTWNRWYHTTPLDKSVKYHLLQKIPNKYFFWITSP